MSNGTILIIDDEPELRKLLSRLLILEDFFVYQAENIAKGLEILEKEDIQVIITDVKLPDGSGVDAIQSYKKISPESEVILLTAYGTIQDGVKAIKTGAFDYITKGDEDNKILPIVIKAIEKQRMQKRILQLEEAVERKFNFTNIISTSKAIELLKEEALNVSNTDVPVLILGETGTGKELFAQAIHNASERKNHSFVAVNCSAIAKDLLESEMFGYKAGAFTGAIKNKKGLFEEANNGTLFLDEIGEMDLLLQAKLLRAIETNSFIKQGDTKPTNVNVRIISATNKNPEELIKSGLFRSDLFYRISLIKLQIPALRERKEDIIPLADFFIENYSKKIKKQITNVDSSYYEKLVKYDFPGNIRELRNIIERSIIISRQSILFGDTLPIHISGDEVKHKENYNNEVDSLDEYERKYILEMLNRCNGNKTRTAELLGIGITTLYRKLQSYGID